MEKLQEKKARRQLMAREGRALKKVNKVLKRVEKHIDDTREALEDLEIEFDVLKATCLLYTSPSPRDS